MSEYLYIISESENGPVKIGISKEKRSRLSALQTGNPRPLRLFRAYPLGQPLAFQFERILHEELSAFQIMGEWFDLSEQFMEEYMPDFWLSHGIDLKEYA